MGYKITTNIMKIYYLVSDCKLVDIRREPFDSSSSTLHQGRMLKFVCWIGISQEKKSQ